MKIYTYKGKKNLCGDRIRIERLISRIEIGTRFVTDYELKLFAKVLNVTVDDLLEEDDTMES